MIILLTLIFILFGSIQPPSSTADARLTTEADVEDVVMKFFEAMRESDNSAMQEFLTAEATLYTVVTSEKDRAVLRETKIQSFLRSVGEAQPESLDEQITSFVVHVDGNLSTAWMDYQFYFNGEFSHCGVNTMNLIRTETGWKIFSIVDTRHQESC